MRLDFNEANILIQTIEDLEKYKKPVTKSSLIFHLNELMLNTDRELALICQSIRSLSSKLEPLSEESIKKICSDVLQDNVVATARYALPNL